jgi:hypothetical protein
VKNEQGRLHRRRERVTLNRSADWATANSAPVRGNPTGVVRLQTTRDRARNTFSSLLEGIVGLQPGEGPTRFLKGYKGYFQADALAQYEGLYGADAITHVCCVAHARRKFVAASDAGDERAAKALEMIGRLYAVERALPPLLPPSDDPVQREQRRQREEERRQLRQRDAEPVWDELSKWLGAQKSGALPKSPLGTAIGYASNNWDALKRYLERGFLARDNNRSERTLRAIALGRNAWGVLGSEVGGRTAAVLYSLVGTCRHLGIDPFAYLREALPARFALGGDRVPSSCWIGSPTNGSRARGGMPRSGA